MTANTVRIKVVMGVVVAAMALASCGSGATATAGIETAAPAVAQQAIADQPEVVVLDIRTPQEVAEGRIAGAVNIDFYEDDFAVQIAELDRNASYVVYCRSGNRSGQAMELFEDLGFADVTEVDGGIVAWYEAGLPIEQ